MSAPRPFQDARLERAFRRNYLVSGLRFSRLALFVGACLAAAFWLSLALVFPDGRFGSARQLIRLTVVLVLGASALFLYLQPRRALRRYALAVGGPAAIACAAIAVLGLLPFDFEYQRNARLATAMTVACWLMYGFTRLPTRNVAIICGSASTITVVGASLHQDEYLVALTVYLFFANLVGWSMSVGAERRERALFASAAKQRELKRQLGASARESAQANAAKSRVLAAVDHDLRQPLTSMMLYLALIESVPAAALPAPVAIPLARIRECAAAMSCKLARLSDTAEAPTPHAIIPTAPVDLREVLRRLSNIFGAQADQRGVRLLVRFPPAHACLVLSSEDRLWDVLSNLVGNALKFVDGKRKSWVLVRASQRGGELRITVRDNGIGIDPALHDRVFDEHFQVDASGFKEGRGLGLSIVGETVSRLPAHRLSMASIPGRGTRFDICLPRHFPAPQPDRAATGASTLLAGQEDLMPSREPALDGCYALVVDDHPPSRRALAQTMESWGMLVESAGSLEEAISLVRRAERLFDLVVSGFGLSGLTDGGGLVDALRCEQGRQTPAIIVSGQPVAIDPERLPGFRARVIAKPLDPLALRAEIVACMGT